MAAGNEEYGNCFEEINIPGIIKIQALIRGYLARKWFRELQDVYIAVVSEIQRDALVDVIWKRNMCKPQVLKPSISRKLASQKKDFPEFNKTDKKGKDTRDKTNTTCFSEEKTAYSLSPRSLSSLSEYSHKIPNDLPDMPYSKSVKSVDVQTDREAQIHNLNTLENEEKDSLCNSVETQTSMIEVRQDNENMIPGHDINTVMLVSNSDKKLIEFTQDEDVVEKTGTPSNSESLTQQNELHLNLDSHGSGTDSETNHELPVEGGGLNLINTDRVVTEDFDQISDKISEKGSLHSNKSPQNTARSETSKLRVSENPKSGQNSARSQVSDTEQAKDHEKHFDIVRGKPYRSDSPSAIPDKKGGRNQISPSPRGRRVEKQRFTSQDSSVLTNVTSVWDSVNSLRDSYTSPNLEIPTTLPSDREQLHSLRKNIAMELLWVQQAINSRKNYLRLKQKM